MLLAFCIIRSEFIDIFCIIDENKSRVVITLTDENHIKNSFSMIGTLHM